MIVNNKRLRRPCIKCHNYFRPTGKCERICEDCKARIRAIKLQEKLKIKYSEIEKEVKALNNRARLLNNKFAKYSKLVKSSKVELD